MIKALEDAIEKVKLLPEERQRLVARLIEELALDGDAVGVLDEEERRLVREGVADLDSGRIVSDAEMEKFWSRNRE